MNAGLKGIPNWMAQPHGTGVVGEMHVLKNLIVGPYRKAVPFFDDEFTPQNQFAADGQQYSSLALVSFEKNFAGGTYILFGKSRSGIVGKMGSPLQDGDVVGAITFVADNGLSKTSLDSSIAEIRSWIDGPPGSGMPGALIFEVADNTGNKQSVFYLNSSYQAIIFGRSNNDTLTLSLDAGKTGRGVVVAYDVNSETVGLVMGNSQAGQLDFQMYTNNGANCSFQLSVNDGSGGLSDFYVSKGNLRFVTAEAGKYIKFNAGDSAPDNLLLDDSKRMWVNGLRWESKTLQSAHTLASVTGTEVTDLQFSSVDPGQYVVTYYLKCQSSATGTGIGTGINFTGGLNDLTAIRREATTGTTQATGVIDDVSNTGLGQLYEARATKTLSTTSPNMLNTGGFATANADCLVIIELLIDVSSTGDLELWHSSETANNTSISPGSYATLRQSQ